MSLRREIRKKEHGFSLVEALVALLVLSIGMLGVALLYVEGMRLGRSAIIRTQAVNLAADMADRITSNPVGQAAYGGAGAANNCDIAVPANCDPVQMAADDIQQWQLGVANTLPNGVGLVAFAVGPPDIYTISVSWVEPSEPAPLSYVLTVER